MLGQYSNQRSTNSAAPAGEADSTEVLWLPTASGPMPIAAQINGRLYAIDSDHLNTPRRLTNTQGQVVWQWLITGYGEVAPTTGATGYAFEAPQLGGSSNSSGNVYSEEVNFKLRYPGQVWDEETGLSYNLNRYYDGQAGRYVQSDPIGLDGGWNRFTYVGGNPLSFIDPLGLCPCGDPINLIDNARADTRDWSKQGDRREINSGFGPDKDTCNLFVDTQYEGAGYNLPNTGGRFLSRLLEKYPPGAGELSKPGYEVPGWPTVSGPAQPGDLIAHGGHVGIATSSNTTISASPSGVIENRWGFRADQQSVIRRCSCAK